MEIVNKNAALLSNYEVYKLLKETKEIQDLKFKKQNTQQHTVDKHLPTIIYESLKYLEKTPSFNYSKEIIEAFLLNCEKYQLTKAEKLQLLNQRPTSEVELLLLVENSEERFTQEQMEEILEFIRSSLPSIEGEVEEEQANINDEEGEQVNEEQQEKIND